MKFHPESLLLLLLFLLSSLSLVSAQPTKNFIFVVPDGYGLTSQVLARDYHAFKTGTEYPNSTSLGVDDMLIGSVRTHSLNRRITDSAAAATAFACGIKTNNGMVGITPDGLPHASILEAAHLAGMRTALVATSRITHATPAGYSSHVRDRALEPSIAAQQVGKTHPFGPFVDILMGGGRDSFHPELIQWAKAKGYTYADSKADLNETVVALPFLGLFAPSHLKYEINRARAEDEPSLLDMTRVAIASLQNATQSRDRGFFIMIEASRIDHAGHANDAAAHIQEVLMYNTVMTYLRDFVSAHPDTQLLSAADHECGGLTLEDGYEPSKLEPAMKSSAHYIIEQFRRKKGSPQKVLFANIGKLDIPGGLSSREKNLFKKNSNFEVLIGQVLAKRAGVSWATTQHSAVDTALYGYASPEKLVEMTKAVGGNIDNTEIPRYIERALGLDMAAATEMLRKKMGWGGMNLAKRGNHSQCG